jgi:hypothetical protein
VACGADPGLHGAAQANPVASCAYVRTQAPRPVGAGAVGWP